MRLIKNIFIFSVMLFVAENIFAMAISTRADYVIVGAGTAGALLAKKLSDDQITSVLAIHNGPNVSGLPIIRYTKFVPFTVVSGLFGPPFYQTGESTPQVHANNREIPWTMAITLGGATSVNAGAYCRGTSQVYSRWEAINGPLWSVDRIFSIYKYLENYQGQTTNPNSRGFAGPIIVRQVPNPTLLAEKFSQAIIAATGAPFVLDYNDNNTPIGVSPNVQYTQMGPNGVYRESAVNIFLNRRVMSPLGNGVNGRKLKVLFNSNVLRIIWQGKKAIGVEYLAADGTVKSAFANRAVIITAGVASSAILMRSGVGPENVLQALHIPVIYNNPNVGKKLVDQPQELLLFATDPYDTPSANLTNFLTQNNSINSKLIQTRVGQLILNSINRSLAPLPNNIAALARQSSSQGANNNSVFAEISWLSAPNGAPNTRALRFSIVNPLPGFALALFDLVQPDSKGYISINSSDPLAPFILNFGVFSNPNDLALYKNGFKTYIKAINQTIHAIDPQYELIFPDPAILDNDALLTQFIKENVASNMSFEESNRMAPLNQGGVVDNRGHVYGVQNLIVADDSIVPVGMDGSSMASAYLIAENIGRIILGQ